MKVEVLMWLIGIVGALISIILGINAYFIKQMLESLNQVKIQTAVLINTSSNSESRIEKIEDRLHKITNKVTVLEAKEYL